MNSIRVIPGQGNIRIDSIGMRLRPGCLLLVPKNLRILHESLLVVPENVASGDRESLSDWFLEDLECFWDSVSDFLKSLNDYGKCACGSQKSVNGTCTHVLERLRNTWKYVFLFNP